MMKELIYPIPTQNRNISNYEYPFRVDLEDDKLYRTIFVDKLEEINKIRDMQNHFEKVKHFLAEHKCENIVLAELVDDGFDKRKYIINATKKTKNYTSIMKLCDTVIKKFNLYSDNILLNIQKM